MNELEFRVARLEAEVRLLKSMLIPDKAVAYDEPGSNPCAEVILTQPVEYSVPTEYSYRNESYREEQARLREAGWDAYNCDMVDEFVRW